MYAQMLKNNMATPQEVNESENLLRVIAQKTDIF